MKKIYTLILMAACVFAAQTPSQAIEFKAKGQWVMSFDYGEGMRGYSSTRGGNTVYGSGYGNPSSDTFEATQRLRLQLHAIASESLSGTVFFEIGETTWGQAGYNNSEGGALGADGISVKVKGAYIDWIVPDTELSVRMGLQGLGLPAFPTRTSQILDTDVAGIVLNYKFNDKFSATAFWARPYNDNFDGYTYDNGNTNETNFLDNVDMVGLLLPMDFGGVKMTPWVMYTAVGQNFARSYDGSMANSLGYGFTNMWSGLFPVGMQGNFISGSRAGGDMFAYGDIIHAGFTGSIIALDPWHFAWDFNYGDASYGKDALDRSGWYAALLAEYKMHWGTPGIYAWYSSGDDEDISNGSERMPTMDVNNGENSFTPFAGNGAPYIERSGIIGQSLVGTWGVGVRLKDFAFMEDLKHTIRINYFNGTNSPEMAKYMRGVKPAPQGLVFTPSANTNAAFDTASGIYMTTEDSAMEFSFNTNYKVYDNFEILLDAAYLALWMNNDHQVWGSGFEAADAWNVNASFVYSF